MALQHKTKLRVYWELIWDIGFEEYLGYVKEVSFRLFLKFCLGTHGLFEELCRHDKGGGSQECPNCMACKESFEHLLFKCASYDFQRLDFFDFLKTVLLPDAFKSFLHDSFCDQTVFCLGEKQGMLVNDECSSCYNRVGDFLSIN